MDTFVARVDCKAFRNDNILEIIHLHFENIAIEMDIFASLFAEEIKKYALFNGCDKIVLKAVTPNKYFEYINKEI